MAAAPMIRCGEQQRTHAEALRRAGRIAAGLADLGVGAGDRVAVVLRNAVEFVEASVGIGLIGAVPVAVNWHWKGAELRYLLADSGTVAAFVHSDLRAAVEAASPTRIPLIEVVPAAAPRAAEVPAGYSNHAELEQWLTGWPEPVDEPVGAPLSVIYTSGTTGKPKGVLRGATDAEQREAVVRRVLSAFGLEPSMRTLVPAPIYHTAPNAHALISFAAGIDLTIMPKFEPRELLATVARLRIEHIQMVPTMFVRLLRLPEAQRGEYDLSSLRAVVHAAAPCSPEVKRQMIDWFGPIILEYYGGTETGAVVACDTEQWLAHPGTVGKALPGADVKIFLPDGTEAPVGAVGEVYLSTGYAWPDFTYIGQDAKRREIERDGYLTLGDIGRLDCDGFLYLSDRANDMVISGGVNIYPTEIEQNLIGLPGVRDVAVFGIPDPDYGESLAAHVDTDPESGLTEHDIREHVRAHLAGYKVPKVVVLDRDLPREESGKLFKRSIRDRYLNPNG